MNWYVPALVNTCENCVPFGSSLFVLLNVSGPERTSTLWPPSTTFQTTDSPTLIWLVVSDGFCQSMVTLAAMAGDATARGVAPANASVRIFFMGMGMSPPSGTGLGCRHFPLARLGALSYLSRPV